MTRNSTRTPRTTVRSTYGYDEAGKWSPQGGAQAFIGKREAFDAGNLTGGELGHYIGPGELTDEARERFAADVDRANRAGLSVYVVLSYQTPILWAVQGERPVMPRTRYSLTTTHHQSVCLSAFGLGTYLVAHENPTADDLPINFICEGRMRRSGRSPYGPRVGWY